MDNLTLRATKLRISSKQMHIPIALDESLIGVIDSEAKSQLLDTVKPQYIILKPSLVVMGRRGYLAESKGTGCRATSALEVMLV